MLACSLLTRLHLFRRNARMSFARSGAQCTVENDGAIFYRLSSRRSMPYVWFEVLCKCTDDICRLCYILIVQIRLGEAWSSEKYSRRWYHHPSERSGNNCSCLRAWQSIVSARWFYSRSRGCYIIFCIYLLLYNLTMILIFVGVWYFCWSSMVSPLACSGAWPLSRPS